MVSPSSYFLMILAGTTRPCCANLRLADPRQSTTGKRSESECSTRSLGLVEDTERVHLGELADSGESSEEDDDLLVHLQFACLDAEGKTLVVAGQRGIAHCNLVAMRWKIFGNESQVS